MLASLSVEQIQSRLLFEPIEGITVVSHGFQLTSQGGDSLMPLASAIRDRADSENGSERGAWLLDYDVSGEGGRGSFDMDSGFVGSNFEYGSQLAGSASHIVLLFDWAAESMNHQQDGEKQQEMRCSTFWSVSSWWIRCVLPR